MTHDPRITELVEQAAEARHGEAVGHVEMTAMHLQDALKSREYEEMQRTRELMGQETAELRGKYTRKLNMRSKDNSKVLTPPLKSARG